MALKQSAKKKISLLCCVNIAFGQEMERRTALSEKGLRGFEELNISGFGFVKRFPSPRYEVWDD